MTYANTARYVPYGAFELKACYQRNLIIGNALVFATVLLLAVTFWLGEVLSPEPPPIVPVRTLASDHIRPIVPPTIIRPEGGAGVRPPYDQRPGAIPVPVVDSMANELDSAVITPPSEYGRWLDADTGSGGGGGGIQIDTTRRDVLEDPPDFQPMEIQPEMIHFEQPVYPHLATVIGQSGTVWVKALLDEDGNVVKALVARSSGSQLLDDAAVAGASKNKFRPGIQNGVAVRCWVIYRVEFVLN